MNMKSPSRRLDDKINGILVAAAVSCVLAITVRDVYDASIDSSSPAVQTAVVDYQHLVNVLLAAL